MWPIPVLQRVAWWVPEHFHLLVVVYLQCHKHCWWLFGTFACWEIWVLMTSEGIGHAMRLAQGVLLSQQGHCCLPEHCCSVCTLSFPHSMEITLSQWCIVIGYSYFMTSIPPIFQQDIFWNIFRIPQPNWIDSIETILNIHHKIQRYNRGGILVMRITIANHYTSMGSWYFHAVWVFPFLVWMW